MAAVLLAPVAYAQPISVGIRGGVPLTGAFDDVTTSSGTDSTRLYSASHEYMFGAMLELHLPLGFSVEADALYHPLDLTQTTAAGPVTSKNSQTIQSVEFPILAKYHFLPLPLVKPYVEAGPSFRATFLTFGNSLSKTGVTIGAGVELKLARLRLEPELRYIHWGTDASSTSQFFASPAASNLNQVEFLVGFAF